MNRRTHRNHSSSKFQARMARVQDKLAKLRDRIRRSSVMFWERRQARLTWWQQAFCTPMSAGRWVFSQARTLWAAFLSLLGLAPSGRARLLARRSDIHGNAARKAVSRSRLYAEGLEQRQLLAGDLYVDQPVDYAPSLPADLAPVTWAGPDGSQGTGDDIPALVFGATGATIGANAFGSIQDAITAATPGQTIRVAPGNYTENLVIDKSVTLIGSGAAGTVLDASGIQVRFTGIASLDNVTLQGFHFKGDGLGTFGVYVDSTDTFNSLTIEDSTFDGFLTDAVFVGGDATSGLSVGSVSISNSDFSDNGRVDVGYNGDINFFHYNGNVSLTDLTIEGYRNEGSNTGARFGIQIVGVGNGAGVGVLDMGTVDIDNVDISGKFRNQMIKFEKYGVSHLTLLDLKLGGPTSEITGWFGSSFRFDGVGAGGTVAVPESVDLGNTAFRGLAGTSAQQSELDFAPDNTFAFLDADGTSTTWDIGGSPVLASALTSAQAYEVENRIFSYADDENLANTAPYKGIIRLVPGKIFVTPAGSGGSSGALARAVELAASGNTIAIAAGAYSEDIDATPVGKDLVIAAGGSPAQVGVAGISLNSGDTLPIEIIGTNPATQFDNFIVNGSVTLGNATLTLPSPTVAAFQSYMIIDNDLVDPVVDTFNGLIEGAQVGTYSGIPVFITYQGGTGNDVVLLAGAPVNIAGKSNTDENLSGNFQIALPANAPSNVLVYYTLSGTAAEGVDYPLQSGTATITAGTSFTNLPIAAYLDNVLEPTENVTLSLTGASGPGVTVGPTSSKSILIFDKDKGQVNLTVTDGSISEVGDTAGQFMLSLQDTLANPLTSTTATTVTFSVGGTATPGSDFVALGTTTAVIPIGSSQVPIDITALNDTINWDNGETIILTITGTIGTSHPSLTVGTSPATITISDPTRPIASVSAVSTTVSEGGTAPFLVSLNSMATDDVTLALTFGGQASAGVDFTPASTTVIILTGQSTQVVNLAVTNDTFTEDDETIAVGLSYIGGNVALDGNTSTATISANDPSTLTVTGGSVTEGGSTSLTFSLTNPADVDTVFTFGPAGGSAGTGDYSLAATTVTILASSTVATVAVTATADTLVEGTENLLVSLSSQTGGPSITLDASQATVTINDANSAAYSVTGGTVLENAGTGDFTISIDTLSQNDTTVTFTVAAGTAMAGLDYTTPSATIAVISAGSSSVLVPVTILDNSVIEPDETLTMSLTGASDSNSGSYVAGSTPATLTIDDNDTATINILASPISVIEPAVSVTENFLLYMTNPSDNPVTVTLSFGGDATGGAGFDYTPATSTVVTFPANQQFLNVPVTFLGDSIVEGNETVIASITGAITGVGVAAGTIVAGTPDTMTIIDDDSATVALSAATVTVNEGSTALLTLVQSALASTDTTISYNFVAGSASAADVTNTISGTAVIASGTTEAVIAIDTVDDTWAEATETFTVSLLKTGGDPSITLSTTVGTVDISANDPVTVDLSGPTSVAESTVGPQTLTYTVALSGPSQEAVTVRVKTTDGTASVADGDYNAEDLTVTIGADTTAAPSATFTVVVNDDAIVEAPETLTVELVTIVDDNGSSATLGTSITTLTIDDNDVSTLSITGPASVSEGVGTFDFTIALSAPSTQDTVVLFSRQNGPNPSATNNNDYSVVNNQTITIGSGTLSATVAVSIVEDNIDEVDENFRGRVELTGLGGNGASIAIDTPVSGRSVATITIQDNDNATIDIAASATVTETPGGSVLIPVTSSPSSEDITVYYQTNAGSASTLDYTPVTSSFVILGNNNSTLTVTSTITVAIADDVLVEGPESFSVSLTSVSGGNSPVLGASVAQVTILDNDSTTLSVSGPSSVTEGPAVSADFTLALSTTAEVDTVVSYTTVPNTASDTSDFTPTSGTAVITAGQSSVTVSVPIVNNNTAEGTENFSLSLTGSSSSASVVMGTSSVSVDIVDDDVATVSVSPIVDAQETVSGTIGIPGGFLVSMTNTVDVDTTVSYSVAGGATPGTDYTALTSSVIIPTGSTTAVIYVDPINDTLVEGNEDVVVTLTGTTPTYGGSVTHSATPAVVTIIDNDSSTLSVSGGTVSETLGGSTATFTLSLSNPSATDTVVSYSIGGSATPGSDFTPSATTGVVTISASVTSVPVVMSITDDSLVEGSETIILTATTITGMVSGVGADNTITIEDNDQAQIKIIPSAASVTEAGSPQFVVFTDKLAQDAMTVTLTLSGTAQPGGVDYTGTATQIVIIPAMSSSTLLSVALIDDTLVESSESLIATLNTVTGNASSLTIGSPSTATISISDNDSAVIDISNPTITVNEGVGSAVVTITLSNPSDIATVVSYTMTDGSASSTLDYTSSSGTVSFAPSATLATISIPINQELLVENDETFNVGLTSPIVGNTSISLGVAAGTVTITDNDSATISVMPSVVSVTEGTVGPGTANVTISMSALSSQDVTVPYSTADGTALAASDYTAVTSSVIISAGSSTVVVPITITTDSTVEPDETLTVSLGAASGHPSITVGAASVTTISITDDDSATVSVSNPNVTVAEGGVAVFTLTQSALSASDTVISYAFTAGTALAADVTGTTSGLATIGIGQSTAVVSISTFNDTIVEQVEAFTVALSKVSGEASVSLSTPVATATITDSDTALLRIFAADSSPSQSVPESVGNAQRFYLSLTAASSTATTVTYNVSGDATSGTDYGAIATEAIIPAGTTSFPISVSISEDTIVENSETISLSLSASSNSSITIVPTLSSVASAIILDNDGTVTASVSPIASTITEGANSGFAISLSAVSGLPTVVTYSLVNSASLTTADYSGVTMGVGSVTIAAGTTTANISFSTVDDSLLESDETMAITLTGATGVTNTTFDGTPSTVTIQDNDTASLAIVALQNGNEAGPVNGLFQIQLTHPADTNTTIVYSVEGSSTATAGATDDYSPLSGTAVISAGLQSVDVTVAVNDDSLVEGSEIVVLKLVSTTLSDPEISIVPLANDMATVTIADDDGSFVSVLDTSVNESVGNATVTLSLSNPSVNPIIVSYTVSDGSAKVASLDYTVPATLTASFAAGSTTTTITVPITDDSLVEGDETVEVSLTSLVSGGPSVSLSGTAGTVTISDNDNSTISVTGGSSTEGSALDYTVSLSNLSDEPTTVTFGIAAGGSAEAADYTAPVTTEVVVPANSSTVQFSIATSLDSFVEGNETLQVSLSAVSGTHAGSFTLSGTNATATIVDDDAATATISAVTAAASEALVPVDGLFQVTLTGASDEARTVHYNIGSGAGSATNSADYTSIASFVVVPIGQTTADITIGVIDDTINEVSETVVLSLTSVSTANEASLTLASVDITPATVTIADNDLPFVSVSLSTATVSEGGSATITFQLDKPANDNFTLNYDLGGNASLASDFSPALTSPASVSFTVGQTVATAIVTTFNDTFVEGDETLTVSLSSISGGTLAIPAAIGSPALATLTIDDNDDAFLTVVKLQDGNDPATGPAVNGVFYVNMTKPSQSATTIAYSVGGTANNTPSLTLGDYTALTGTLILAIGQTDAFITVAVQDDLIVENDETVILKLESLTGASNPAIQIVTTGNEIATLTITDADVSAISVVSVPTSVTEGSPAAFRVEMTRPADTDTYVTLSLNGGSTAANPDDYTGMGSSTVVMIPSLATSVDVTLSTVNDTLAEGDETVIVTATATPAYGGDLSVGAFNSATLTINDTPDALVVEGVVINNNDLQRSRVTVLSVTLNGVVPNTPANQAAITVQNRQSLAFVGLGYVFDYSTPGKTKITLSFTGAETEFSSLKDGNYQLNIGAGLTYAGGTLGSAFTYGGVASDKFYRLFGDVDANRTINAVDYNALLASFGINDPRFDINMSGTVEAVDYNALLARFGSTLVFA